MPGHPGAVAVPLPAASGAFGPLVTDGYVRVLGASAAETVGTAKVTVVIRDNGSATGNVICVVGPAAGGADHDWKGPQPIRARKQLYAQVIGTGTVAGSVFVA